MVAIAGIVDSPLLVVAAGKLPLTDFATRLRAPLPDIQGLATVRGADGVVTIAEVRYIELLVLTSICCGCLRPVRGSH